MRIHYALVLTLSVLAPSAWGAASYTGQVWGDLSNATSYAVVGSSSSTSDKAVNFLVNIEVSTLTVTLRGGRALNGQAQVYILNGGGGSRIYSVSVNRAGVPISNTYQQIITAGDQATIPVTWTEIGTTAGSNVYTLEIKSSSVTGTQTAKDRIITVTEL